MDVTCERCATEYEFDETLLSGRGTSVKCTNCGHVFKVYPKAQPDADRTTSTWQLKLQDGSIDTIDSLRVLQRRIASGELTPADEISRGEEGWKPLGSIPELETFFQAAEAGARGNKVPDPVSVPPAHTPPEPTDKESSLPPGRRPRQPTLLGHVPVPKPGEVHEAVTGSVTEAVTAPVTAPVTEFVSGSVTESVAVPETESVTEAVTEAVTEPLSEAVTQPVSTSEPAPKPDIEDAEFEERVGSVRLSTPPPVYYDDDNDIPELSGRGWSPTRWLVLVVMVGGLALVATQWQRVARMVGIGADPEAAAAAVQEGDSALAADHLKAYETAIEAYGRALDAQGGEDPALMAKLSNAHALAAQALIDAEPENEAAQRIEGHATAALNNAEGALVIDAQRLDAKLAEADALRLIGENARAREMLEQARAMPFSRTAEFFRIDARLRAADADGKLEKGLLSANQAVEANPEGIRYRLLLARAEHASGDEGSALEELDAVLQAHPDHPVAAKLREGLVAEEAAVGAGVTVDAGAALETAPAETASGERPAESGEPPAAAGEQPAESGEPPPAAGERPAESGERKPARERKPAKQRKPAYDEYDRLEKAARDDAFIDGRPPVRDYGWYMRQGRAELAGGNYDRARAYFDSALEARPGSAEATHALGKVAFELEDYNLALRYFRSAAQRGDPNGYFDLGRAYERLGRNEEAVSAYYTYLKRRPSGIHAAAAKAAIKTLEPRAKLPPEVDPEPEPEPDPAPEPPEPKPEPEGADEPAQGPGPAAP